MQNIHRDGLRFTVLTASTFIAGLAISAHVAVAQNQNEDDRASKLGTGFGGKESSSQTEPGETHPDKQGLEQGGNRAAPRGSHDTRDENAPSATASPQASFPEASTAHTTADDLKRD
ncbi:MAG: hypothetical protein U0136_21545 [Bdellovibrionota bacterium]